MKKLSLLVVALVIVGGGTALADKPSYDHDHYVRGGGERVAPNVKRDVFMPADDEKGTMRGVHTGVERAKGEPVLRPDPRRDAFTPVDEVSGKMRGLPANGPVKAKKVDRIMPNVRRDAFTPADEVSGAKRGLGLGNGLTTAKKSDKIMPNPRRDAFMPADESTGVTRGLGTPEANARRSEGALRLHARGEGVDANACLLRLAGCF